MTETASTDFSNIPYLTLPSLSHIDSKPDHHPIIAVVIYSTYGHIEQLAEGIIKGVEATGAEVRPYVFRETLSEEILGKMHASGTSKSKYPIITPADFKAVDGVIIGTPTRYGRVPAQVSTFFDQCGSLWAAGAMVGKFVSMFTSTGGQHGGQEVTALTTMPFFIHMGMVYVPIAYSHPYVNEVESGLAHGCSPWGASTIAGSKGERVPTGGELEVAVHQGKMFAEFVGTYVKGKQV